MSALPWLKGASRALSRDGPAPGYFRAPRREPGQCGHGVHGLEHHAAQRSGRAGGRGGRPVHQSHGHQIRRRLYVCPGAGDEDDRTCLQLLGQRCRAGGQALAPKRAPCWLHAGPETVRGDRALRREEGDAVAQQLRRPPGLRRRGRPAPPGQRPGLRGRAPGPAATGGRVPRDHGRARRAVLEGPRRAEGPGRGERPHLRAPELLQAALDVHRAGPRRSGYGYAATPRQRAARLRVRGLGRGPRPHLQGEVPLGLPQHQPPARVGREGARQGLLPPPRGVDQQRPGDRQRLGGQHPDPEGGTAGPRGGRVLEGAGRQGRHHLHVCPAARRKDG
mmetsp:Transcript_80237/g.227200  ORF Transcript_80237/g.227200 Transcript_80237/m.227200 type:complete len:334 (+) Transcript_80237:2-1003(+)